jgi:hypothetical protein
VDAAGLGVDAVLDGAQVGFGDARQVGALADVAADQAVAVLVGRALDDLPFLDRHL